MREFFDRNKRIVIVVIAVISLLLIGLISYIKITGKDISSNGVKAIILPSVIYKDDVSGIYVDKGSKATVRATLRYFGTTKYYYKHSVYAGDMVAKTTDCRKVKSGHYTEYELNMNFNNVRVGTVIYKDNKCTKKVASYSSLVYKLKNTTSNSSSNKVFTATFNKNGASSIGSKKLSCKATGNSCTVVVPSITRKGYTIVGWGDSPSSTTAKVKPGEKVTLTKNITFYAVTKKTYTATFDTSKLDYIESSKLSCSVYNRSSSCSITLPQFNKKGAFNAFWSSSKIASSNLEGKTFNANYFYQVGTQYNLFSDKTFYPNFNNYSYNKSNNYHKYRSFSTQKTEKIGKTIFEFESGIPVSSINNYLKFLKSAYNTSSWLFVPAKVFVMKHSTYNNYSIAYGLTQTFSKGSYAVIDLQYDENGVIDQNAALHELAHAWDHYYGYKKGRDRLSTSSDIVDLYNKMKANNRVYINDKDVLSRIEWFAAMTTNYYWHILGKDTRKQAYGLCQNCKLTSAEKNEWKNIIEKYIKITKQI